MNNLMIFKNEKFGVIKTIVKEGEPLFLANPLAEILGYSKTNGMVKRLDDDEKIEFSSKEVGDVLGCTLNELGVSKFAPSLMFITESGLYNSILGSNKKEAKQFKKWVTSEVLPSIRKHGAYMTNNILEKALTSPDFLIQLATNLKEEQEKRRLLEEEKKLNAPKVVFADAVSTSHTSILIGDLAKLIKQNGVDIGGKRLFSWLRENGYLIKRKGTDYNMPTQKSMELELFEVKETTINHSDGHISISKTPKVTGKGQQYFINKFLN
ncbi:phage antirepressor [Clostridium perfringens]|uniref:phage antirepressor n=1 Tax=Clostridium perfringens TaxID=1502 RepID=UPI003D32EC41